jgi:predicted RNase H-like HicB family nuclease
MIYTVECEQEIDGRWIADIIDIPGVMVYASTREKALNKVQALAHSETDENFKGFR